jgi:hypothetical protein
MEVHMTITLLLIHNLPGPSEVQKAALTTATRDAIRAQVNPIGMLSGEEFEFNPFAVRPAIPVDHCPLGTIAIEISGFRGLDTDSECCDLVDAVADAVAGAVEFPSPCRRLRFTILGSDGHSGMSELTALEARALFNKKRGDANAKD